MANHLGNEIIMMSIWVNDKLLITWKHWFTWVGLCAISWSPDCTELLNLTRWRKPDSQAHNRWRSLNSMRLAQWDLLGDLNPVVLNTYSWSWVQADGATSAQCHWSSHCVTIRRSQPMSKPRSSWALINWRWPAACRIPLSLSGRLGTVRLRLGIDIPDWCVAGRWSTWILTRPLDFDDDEARGGRRWQDTGLGVACDYSNRDCQRQEAQPKLGSTSFTFLT